MDSSQVLYTLIWTLVYIAILIGVFYLIGNVVFTKLRRKKEGEHQFNLTFMQVKVPEENEVEIAAAEQMFAGFSGLQKDFLAALIGGQHRISFEIVSKIDGIYFYVVVPDELVTLVEKQINGAYPEAEIDLVDPEEVWDRGAYTSVNELTLAGPSFYPIKVYENLGVDAMSAITSVMSKLGENDALAIQYVISPAGEGFRTKGNNYVGSVRNAQNDPERKIKVDPSFVEGVEKKIAKPGFKVAIRFVSLAEDKINAESHLQNLFSAFEQFTDAKYNRFRRRRKKSPKIIDDFIYRRLSPFRNMPVLNIEELATIFHFPNKNVRTPRIKWLEARKLPPPSNIPVEGTYLGKSVFRGVSTDVRIKRKDRQRHMYIIGQTGTGKSVQLMYLAAQDIQNGEGVCVIDPHGTDVAELMEKIPPERLDDVILFDVSDTERPLGINILEAKTEEQKNMIINGFIALLYKLYDPNNQGIIGPQLERAVRNVMFTAMADPNATMIDVLRMLIDDDYHKKFLPLLDDPLVIRYWTDEVANTSASRKAETMGYFVSKFDRFVTERTMRNIIGQPKSAIDFAKIMAEKKILLVDLAKGKIGEENSSFLGLILVPKILSAAMSRHTLIEQGIDFPDFYLYVDEFQNFATPDFATILSEARKYKLNLTVANQFVSQLTDEIKDAIFGNVGTKLAYRVGNDDAEYLSKQFEPVTPNDLMKSSVGNYYTRLLIEGQPSNTFSVTLPWDDVNAQPKYPGMAEKIREISRLKYGVPVNEVEEYIKKRAGFEDEKPQDPKDIIKDLF